MSNQVEPGPCREMYWHERTDAQKVEKLAEVAELLSMKLAEALDVIDDMKVHSHAGDRLVVPMPNRDGVDGRFRLGSSYFFKNPLRREPAVR